VKDRSRATDGSMTDNEENDGERVQRSPEEWAAERARLAAKLDRHRREQDAAREAEAKPGSMQGMAAGLKIASEFIAGVVVGAVIGYGIDQLFGTRPFGLIAFLLLGFAAGVLNVIRSASGNGAGKGSDTGIGPPN